MLTPILIALAVIVVLFVIIVAMQPGKFSVSRSATVSAPPGIVFAQVNDLHKWEAWNPWGKIDPAMKTAYEGAAAGPGAKYSWTGSAKVGTGSMTITDSRPGELVRLKLEFLKPFKATNVAEFTFKPEGGQTVVTWTMSGEKNFVSKAIGLCLSMDKMCGGPFEKGLADMKQAAEAPNKQ